ncbi:MAG: hypothetical protein A2Z81_09020 [Omnitrophica WOR_2 bacterium GWA2_45_18]|nr:MAG: hypothetical protein A2Z81_09020 [Omnitrophica WOR_2 bacterium GWA2_45_18]
MELLDILPYVLVLMKFLLILTSVIFLISGADDLFIDLWFMGRSFYRKIFIYSRYAPLQERQLLECPEQTIAVMIPAWDESSVIRPMLMNTLKNLNYKNFHIFVGVYPNDLKTQIEVEKVREAHPNIQLCVCPQDGPTNKADCLNNIFLGIKLFEKKRELKFSIFVMQDCEDVIHPLCYKLFNYLIPRNDMVQLPVFSLPVKWSQFTAGHYIDEFAQGHYKDIIVREDINKSIPAAGVGCAFSRRSFDLLSKEKNGQLFSLDSLTEDYDFGFQLKKHGLKQIFVKFAITRTQTRKSFWSKKIIQNRVKEYVCVREYFPKSFTAAVRQKSRWIIGIAFQGWAQLGWKGDLATKYMLFRDRKALVTNFINILGYVVVLSVLSVWFMLWINPDTYRYPPLLERGTWLWNVTLINAAFFGLRIVQRAYCVQRLYGYRQALLSFPRMIWGNLINCVATFRAVRIYVRHLATGKAIAWDKTSHHYPSEEELGSCRCRLGDLLLGSKLITLQYLEEALLHQEVCRKKSEQHQFLGNILMDMGYIKEKDLMFALEKQKYED